MKSGRRSKKSLLKTFAGAVFFVCLFAYANLTADTGQHNAKVKVLTDSTLLTELTRDIAEAEKSVYLAVYMFKSYDNEKNGAGLIKRALKKAAGRGIDVYVALDRSEESDFVDKENKKLGKELEKHNIRVTYDDKDVRMHSKCAVIDEKITYIGSHNYTNSALKYNREITVRIESEGVSSDTLKHILSIK